MTAVNSNAKKWALALLLAIPVFYLYGMHFFFHDASLKPTGFVQWEHMLYMCSAKEYITGNAALFYEWPILNNFHSGPVFFQPQILLLGYLWKFTHASPGIIISAFGFVFALLTLRVIIAIIEKISPGGKYNKLATLLFCWGGGILSICGMVLHFIFFKGTIHNIADNVFFLDPANGSWCLNFGRTLIYPLEAYYHFLFVSCIWLILQRKFLKTFFVMLLLIVSHPYTSIEIISITLTWISIEYFYLRKNEIKKTDLIYIATAFVLYFAYYGWFLNSLDIYKAINKLNALDWGYKAWHFIPAYALVWVMAFLAVKNPTLLKAHFSHSNNRLFFWWGAVAFILSVHGFAIKPVQPIHFARGYVYAGFFLFSLPAIEASIRLLSAQKIKGFIILSVMTFIFLFDNLSWFVISSTGENENGVYFTKEKRDLVDFLKNTKTKGIVIGSEKNYELSSAIQLYTDYKAWIPHPFLTFDIDDKRKALDSLLTDGKLDATWKSTNVYLYSDKNDSTLQQPNLFFKKEFENRQYIVYKIN